MPDFPAFRLFPAAARSLAVLLLAVTLPSCSYRPYLANPPAPVQANRPNWLQQAMQRALKANYEADIEERRGNSVTKAHVIYAAGRYLIRVEGRAQRRAQGISVRPWSFALHSARQGMQDDRLWTWGEASSQDPITLGPGVAPAVQIGNELRSEVTWACYPAERAAWPTFAALESALGVYVQRHGEAAARRQFRLPDAPGIPSPVCMQRASVWLPSPWINPAYTWNDKGEEKVAGFACRKAEQSQQTSFRSRTGNVEMRTTETIWIEPKSGLILRQDFRREWPGQKRRPDSGESYRVTRLKLLSSVPDAAFQLPSGTVAHVPETLRELPLPPGVTRVVTPGHGMAVEKRRIGAPYPFGSPPSAPSDGAHPAIPNDGKVRYLLVWSPRDGNPF